MAARWDILSAVATAYIMQTFCLRDHWLAQATVAEGVSDEFVEDQVEPLFTKGHTNNWAVLVCTSRFWFNYRHVANVLSIYRSVKRLGIPDSRIILMLADDMACNSRNPSPATIYNHRDQHVNVYGDDVEVDYRNYDVTVESFIRLLTGRVPENTPTAKRLLTDEHSNILVYMTGHGGEGFLKFQDSKELTNVELADAFGQMWQMGRYHEILFIVDSCHSESMFLTFYSPNIVAVSSSRIDEDSLSHHGHPRIGVYVIDRYTYYVLQFLEKLTPDSTVTLDDFFKVCPRSQCISTVTTRKDLFGRDVRKTHLIDFFGGVRNIEFTRDLVELPDVSLIG